MIGNTCGPLGLATMSDPPCDDRRSLWICLAISVPLRDDRRSLRTSWVFYGLGSPEGWTRSARSWVPMVCGRSLVVLCLQVGAGSPAPCALAAPTTQLRGERLPRASCRVGSPVGGVGGAAVPVDLGRTALSAAEGRKLLRGWSIQTPRGQPCGRRACERSDGPVLARRQSGATVVAAPAHCPRHTQINWFESSRCVRHRATATRRMRRVHLGM